MLSLSYLYHVRVIFLCKLTHGHDKDVTQTWHGQYPHHGDVIDKDSVNVTQTWHMGQYPHHGDVIDKDSVNVTQTWHGQYSTHTMGM